MKRGALMALLLACALPSLALEWVPIGGITALGGLHTFDGRSGGFTGNVDASLAPAVRLSDEWSVLPSARGVYEGTRRLTDVLGTATVSQQSLEARAGLRGVYGDPASRWRFKPFMSYDAQFLKETPDEAWGQGLFDQRRVTVGGEVELLTDEPHSLRAGANWFKADYPNYTTLESQAAFQFAGQPLARELVGDRALDREGYQFLLAGDAALGQRLAAEGKAGVVWSRFANQRVVDEGGQLTPDVRSDVLTDLSLALRMPHDWNADLRALGGLEVGLTANSSNQNGYDASRGQFLPGFYDWLEWRAEPSASLIIGPVRRPVTATLKLGWKRRSYVHRPAQSATGAYETGTTLS
ncbi:MAG TPA: hypothetical protein VN915_00940, partial [Elusimicrobiota bacterium]|nr:hypothetical protein [Elusimicrobiota bacterium]